MTTRYSWLLLTLVLCPLGAAAQMHKCKDAAGRITYSQDPCPGASTHQEVKIEGEYGETLIKRLLAIAQHGALDDVAFVEKTLGVRFTPRLDRGITFQELAAPPPPFSHWRYGVQTRAGAEGLIQISIEQPRYCIAPTTVVRLFGRPRNDSMNGEERELGYEIRTQGRYTTAMVARFAPKQACMTTMQMRVGHPQR
jgi:hypothetical protein